MKDSDSAWLKAQIAFGQIDQKAAKETLYQLAKESGRVENLSLLKKAVDERDERLGAEIRQNLFVYHAATPGVKRLCAAALASVSRKSDGSARVEKIYVLAAYREKNYFALKRLAALLEVLLDLSGGTNSGASERSGIQSSDDFTEYIERFFLSRGISIFDAESDGRE